MHNSASGIRLLTIRNTKYRIVEIKNDIKISTEICLCPFKSKPPYRNSHRNIHMFSMFRPICCWTKFKLLMSPRPWTMSFDLQIQCLKFPFNMAYFSFWTTSEADLETFNQMTWRSHSLHQGRRAVDLNVVTKHYNS
jgi:hypothetical protein